MRAPLRILSTLLLGAVPATMLSYMGLVGAIFGLASSSFDGVLLALAEALGLVGTYGLWVSAFRRLPATGCLVVGLVGLACAHMALWRYLTGVTTSIYGLWLFVSPGLVAIVHVFRAYRSFGVVRQA